MVIVEFISEYLKFEMKQPNLWINNFGGGKEMEIYVVRFLVHPDVEQHGFNSLPPKPQLNDTWERN